jgi:hypothetical protein
MYLLTKFEHVRIHMLINLYDKEFVEQRNHHETFLLTTYPELIGDEYVIGIDIDSKAKWYNKHFKLSDDHLIELDTYIAMGKGNSAPMAASDLIRRGDTSGAAKLTLSRRENTNSGNFVVTYDSDARYITSAELHLPVHVGDEIFVNLMRLYEQSGVGC